MEFSYENEFVSEEDLKAQKEKEAKEKETVSTFSVVSLTTQKNYKTELKLHKM